MRFSAYRIIFMSSITLVVMICAFNVSEIYGEDNIVMQKLLGVWWTHDWNEVPWAIQFNEDGTFRTAYTHLRLEKSPRDEGRFQLQGTILILTSNTDCNSSCKGMKGIYKVEFTEYDKLLLKKQEDQCMERTEICSLPWTKILP